MYLIELFLIAIGLSADAFAVSVTLGLTMAKSTLKKSLIVGLYFGVFQAIMPVIGYVIALRFSGEISAYGNVVAFLVLAIIGGKMIAGSFKEESVLLKREASLTPVTMVPLALATSIDALAVGVSLAFLQVDIVATAVFIGVATFILSALGLRLGCAVKSKLQARANLLGGVVLVLIAVRILIS